MIEKIAAKLSTGKKIVLMHGNADPDALGSAYALSQCFPDTYIGAPGGMDRVAKAVANKLSIEVIENPDISEYDYAVIVDCSSRDQVSADLSEIECVAIDHHAVSGDWDECLSICNENRKSCAEVILDILKCTDFKIDEKTGMALAAGMITDSGHFKFADSMMMRSFADLLDEAGIEMKDVISITDLKQDVSERVSQLKGMQNMKFERIGDYIAAVSQRSSHEGSVCKAIINAGADIAFVGSQRKDEFRISARAKQDLVQKGFHLGKILNDVTGETNGVGGGHAGAAGLTGKGDIEAHLIICMSRSLDFFRFITSEGENKCKR